MTLPPLPEPQPIPGFYDIECRKACRYTAEQMQAYAASAVAAEREACALVCDQTPPYPFRPSIEAAHAIRARSAV